jgi:hypothetical protein
MTPAAAARNDGWTFADKTDLCVAFFVVFLVGGFAGYAVADEVHERRAAIEAAKPKRAQPVVAPLTQWNCTDQEFREHSHACAGRTKAGLIQQIDKYRKGRL